MRELLEKNEWIYNINKNKTYFETFSDPTSGLERDREQPKFEGDFQPGRVEPSRSFDSKFHGVNQSGRSSGFRQPRQKSKSRTWVCNTF